MFYCNNYESESRLRNILDAVAFFSEAEIDEVEVDRDNDKIIIYLYSGENTTQFAKNLEKIFGKFSAQLADDHITVKYGNEE